MKGCWILSKAFSASIERIMWFLSLLLFMYYITFMDLYMLNHSCIPGMKLTWSWCMIFWHVIEFCFSVFCWEYLYLYSLKKLVYNSLSWFHLYCVSEWVQCWLCRKSLVVSLPFLFPGKVWGVLVLVLL
jgi:hypothetical protein